MADKISWACTVIGLLSAGALAYHPLTNRKLMPKRWAIFFIILGAAAQISSQTIQSHQQSELQTSLNTANGNITSQKTQIDQGQKLIERLSAEVKNQGLKQEANIWMLNRSVADLGAKGSPLGSGSLGSSRLGGAPGPLEKIADALVGMGARYRLDADNRELTDIRFDPRMQAVKYLQLTKSIPSEYDDEAWRAAESVIYDMLNDEVSSNLQRRQIYSKEQLEMNSSVLKAERARFLKAHEKVRKVKI